MKSYMHIYEGVSYTEKEIKENFEQMPEEIRWGDFAGSVSEYIHQGVESGVLVEVSEGGAV